MKSYYGSNNEKKVLIGTFYFAKFLSYWKLDKAAHPLLLKFFTPVMTYQHAWVLNCKSFFSETSVVIAFTFI